MLHWNNKFWEKPHLEADFKYSRQIIKRVSKSFYYSSLLLPPKQKWAIYSIYAFCRYADNIVDSPRNRRKEQQAIEIENLKNELYLAYKYGESEHPIIKSFIYVAKKYDIPEKYPLDLLDGQLWDVYKTRYYNFQELLEYSSKMASNVGYMMLYPMECIIDDAFYYAGKLGIAMQLTNILRDIKEDKDLGRIYLPLDELNNYDIDEPYILIEDFDQRLKDFMQFQCNRVKEYYSEAEKGIRLLPFQSRPSISSAAKIYAGIISKIEKAGYNPWKGRQTLNFWEKNVIIGKETLKWKNI